MGLAVDDGCTAVLSRLEGKARSLGAKQVCLAPGLEVATFGLYEKYGCTVMGSRAVLILNDPGPGVA